MSRTQKKCFIASAGTHLMLVLLLLIGPAFLMSNKSTDLPPLDFIPWNTVDALVSGGGNRNARPPVAPPTPPVPLPTPPQPAVAAPLTPAAKLETQKEQARPEPPKLDKPDQDSLETNKPRKPVISTKLVTRNPGAKTTATDPKAKAQDADRQRLVKEIGQAATGIRNQATSSTTIDTNYGPGTGGPAYANYAQVVKAIYEQAWRPPDDTDSDDAITKVTVTIASDGTVLSARIIQPSGDAQVDRSVQGTLDRVTFIRPFPEGATDKQRTYTINFNLKAKRLLG